VAVSFTPFIRRWFGAKSAAIQSQPSKPDPDTELVDRTEVLLEDLNDVQEHIAASFDSLPGAFLSKGGTRTDENLDLLTGGGDAGSLHTHANVPPQLSNAPPPAVAAASNAGTSVDAARADHTHASPPNPALATAAPPGVGAASAIGSSARAAREDHTHASPPVPALSTTAPPAVAAASSAGTSGESARADHTHASPPNPGLATAAPPAVALESSVGTSAQAAREDHTHAAPGGVLLWGNSGWGTGTATKYADPFWVTSAAGTTPIQVRVPRSGTLRNLMLLARVSGAGTFTARVRVNDVATALAVTVGSGVTQAENLTDSIAVNQGDRIDLEVVRTVAGSPTDVTISAELV
jgi:hypothetical protein